MHANQRTCLEIEILFSTDALSTRGACMVGGPPVAIRCGGGSTSAHHSLVEPESSPRHVSPRLLSQGIGLAQLLSALPERPPPCSRIFPRGQPASSLFVSPSPSSPCCDSASCKFRAAPVVREHEAADGGGGDGSWGGRPTDSRVT